MDERFAVYVDRLRDGTEELIDETVPASLFDLGEQVSDDDQVKIHGKAYLADHSLVIQVNIEATVQLRCVICNELFPFKIELNNLYITPEEEACRSGIFQFKEALREEIVLEIPLYAECHGGSCPERHSMKPYLKEGSSDSDEETQQPFKEFF